MSTYIEKKDKFTCEAKLICTVYFTTNKTNKNLILFYP